MKKTAAALVASGAKIAASPAQTMAIGRSTMCAANTFASLSLESEFTRIDVDADLENATPASRWTVRVTHNDSTLAHHPDRWR